jgi:hypothetical protein
VPERDRVSVGVVTACAAADALDVLVVPGRAKPCRVAEDELLLICEPDLAPEIAREVGTRLGVVDPHALVGDTTDGWTAVSLGRDHGDATFARLSRLRLPDRGFLQGEVAHVPAKVLVGPDDILVLVASALEHHVRTRVAAAEDRERSS